MRTNQFNQPIGENLTHYHLFKYPDARCIKGQYGQLVKLSIKHIDDLYNELCDTSSEANWTYLYDEPFYDKESFMTYVKQLIDNKERLNKWLSSSNFNKYEEQIHHLKAFYKILGSNVVKEKQV